MCTSTLPSVKIYPQEKEGGREGGRERRKERGREGEKQTDGQIDRQYDGAVQADPLPKTAGE